MSELRRDPLTGRWTIIATERGARPHEFEQQDRTGGETDFCPFCEGNESTTPPEILAYGEEDREPNGPGWNVRVVPNKYPALQVEGELHRRGFGVYDATEGVGAHEVFIESPRHITSPTELSVKEQTNVLFAFRERMRDLSNDDRLMYSLIFKNVGERAGASLQHSHSQLIATPVVPQWVEQELDRCKEYHGYGGQCLLCDIIDQELEHDDRVVMDRSGIVVLTPYASRFPFEMWVTPKAHISHFESSSDEVLEGLADVLQDTLARLDDVLESPAYNYMIHTTPSFFTNISHYHWHIEIIPRVTRVAGFEWGTGFHINPVPPESACDFLQEAGMEEASTEEVETATT